MGIRSKKGGGTSKKSTSGAPSDLVGALPSAGPIEGYTLADSDFSDKISKPPTQSCVLIFGDPGEGKTTLATMYAPHPVAYLNFDRRGRTAVYAAKKAGRKILDVDIEHPSDLSRFSNEDAKRLAGTALSKTMRNLEIAVRESQKGNVRTICLDTGTELNAIITTSITGSAMTVKGDYGRSKGLVNQQWWTIFDMAREGKAHLIVLSRSKDIWFNNQPTGRVTYRGNDVMHEAADWAGWMRLRKHRKTKAPTQDFELEITKAGNNIEELGEVYTSDDWEELGGPFAYACWMQNPGTDIEDWQ